MHNLDASVVKYRTRLSMSFSSLFSMTDKNTIVNLLVLLNVTVIKRRPLYSGANELCHFDGSEKYLFTIETALHFCFTYIVR